MTNKMEETIWFRAPKELADWIRANAAKALLRPGVFVRTEMAKLMHAEKLPVYKQGSRVSALNKSNQGK